jgi:hypothetical protein
VVVELESTAPQDELVAFATLFDSDGRVLASNGYGALPERMHAPIRADGDYYLVIDGGSWQDDRTDPGSGIGVETEGSYTATIGRNAGDVDVYGMDLEPGDVVSAKLEGGASNIRLLAPDGTDVVGFNNDLSFVYPAESQLTGGGNAAIDHVAAERGRFALRVSGGSGGYQATVRVLRPGFEQRANAVQTIYLDFDGEEVNTAIWDGPGVRELSPLSAFLGRWGLTLADEDAVIAKTVATVRENLRRDLRRANPTMRVRIRHSGAHRDRFGARNVSRVIVGGTIEESDVETIGIAQSIDPGNFAGEESALVLLDILSEPAGSEIAGEATLNHYIRPESDVVDFVGQALGNIIAHEVGHYIGGWHTDQYNETVNLMDAGGGDFSTLIGVGPDGVGGTDDDTDVDFGHDAFQPGESLGDAYSVGQTGVEDTRSRSAFGLTGAEAREAPPRRRSGLGH